MGEDVIKNCKIYKIRINKITSDYRYQGDNKRKI